MCVNVKGKYLVVPTDKIKMIFNQASFFRQYDLILFNNPYNKNNIYKGILFNLAIQEENMADTIVNATTQEHIKVENEGLILSNNVY